MQEKNTKEFSVMVAGTCFTLILLITILMAILC